MRTEQAVKGYPGKGDPFVERECPHEAALAPMPGRILLRARMEAGDPVIILRKAFEIPEPLSRAAGRNKHSIGLLGAHTGTADDEQGSVGDLIHMPGQFLHGDIDSIAGMPCFKLRRRAHIQYGQRSVWMALQKLCGLAWRQHAAGGSRSCLLRTARQDASHAGLELVCTPCKEKQRKDGNQPLHGPRCRPRS